MFPAHLSSWIRSSAASSTPERCVRVCVLSIFRTQSLLYTAAIEACPRWSSLLAGLGQLDGTMLFALRCVAWR